jgi:DNA-binding PadR family transcriptional regulator
MQQTATLSKDRVRLSAGTLYGALASLLEKGWIEQLPEEGRKKDYRITLAGREVLEQELSRLAELLENGRNVLNNQNK